MKLLDFLVFLGLQLFGIFGTMKKLEAMKTDKRGRKKTARNRRNIQRAKGMIQRSPMTKANSTRKLAKKFKASQESARQILREDLGLKPYKFLKRQMLTAAVKLKRIDRALALYQRFSRDRH
uniref:Uncharacterized protein n=1 Tax=Acrobeloides nanus TaxID=290746 RepID=A0A914EC47_9BILA